MSYLYPATPDPSFNFDITPIWSTIRIADDFGNIMQRRRKRIAPLYAISLKYNRLSGADIATLFNFYNARSGSFEAFNVFDFFARDWTQQFVGNGTGAQDTFNSGGKNTVKRSVYVDGVLQSTSNPAKWGIEVGTGTDGQDKIIFNQGYAPGNGAIVTFSFTGEKYFSNCIFEDDQMPIERFTHLLHRTGLKIRQVPE